MFLPINLSAKGESHSASLPTKYLRRKPDANPEHENQPHHVAPVRAPTRAVPDSLHERDGVCRGEPLRDDLNAIIG